VEDDPDTREMMAELLQPHCAVAVAADGTDALELLTRNGRKFDAIVVDLEMPGLGGLALLSDLRRRGLDVPALVVSGAPGARRGAREARADFISKPFEVETLEAKVDELLRKAS
jgi:two-component system OmpR family response regulator